jgi:hypothetical protein
MGEDRAQGKGPAEKSPAAAGARRLVADKKRGRISVKERLVE